MLNTLVLQHNNISSIIKNKHSDENKLTHLNSSSYKDFLSITAISEKIISAMSKSPLKNISLFHQICKAVEFRPLHHSKENSPQALRVFLENALQVRGPSSPPVRATEVALGEWWSNKPLSYFYRSSKTAQSSLPQVLPNSFQRKAHTLPNK